MTITVMMLLQVIDKNGWITVLVPIYPDDHRLPKNWSISHLKTQLANIGFNLTDEMIAEIDKNRRKR